MHASADTDASWIYVTADTGTVHLGTYTSFKTLCGQLIGGMVLGDETVSGLAGTCRSCKRISHPLVLARTQHLSDAEKDALLDQWDEMQSTDRVEEGRTDG